MDYNERDHFRKQILEDKLLSDLRVEKIRLEAMKGSVNNYIEILIQKAIVEEIDFQLARLWVEAK
jgi:hypothetical protein